MLQYFAKYSGTVHQLASGHVCSFEVSWRRGDSLYYRGMCLTQEQQMEEGMPSRVWGRRRSSRPSAEPLSTSTCSPAWNLSDPILLDFMEDSFHSMMD